VHTPEGSYTTTKSNKRLHIHKPEVISPKQDKLIQIHINNLLCRFSESPSLISNRTFHASEYGFLVNSKIVI
jgi:hypothetical protein